MNVIGKLLNVYNRLKVADAEKEIKRLKKVEKS